MFWKKNRFWSKFPKNVDFFRKFRKIFYFVKFSKKFRFWSKFTKDIDFFENLEKFRFC